MVVFSFDVVDGVSLADRPTQYWSDLRSKIQGDMDTEFQRDEKIVTLKLTGKDGRLRPSDCANAETLFRIIQSIFSPIVGRSIAITFFC